MPTDVEAIAAELVAARSAGRTLDVPLTDRGPLDLDTAYRIQRAVTGHRLARGERIVGWKLGYTSAAMRRQMGVDGPNFGPLTDAMMLTSGQELPAGALQPRVEPEIGLRLAAPVPPGASVADVLDRCAAAVACLEVVDSVWTGYRFRLEDNTADGSSAAWVVVGPELPLHGLAELAVTLTVDGADVASATGAAADGHPARGVAWLAEQLRQDGRGLRAGDLVITGGLTAAVPLSAGTTVGARFGADLEISVSRRRRA